MKPKSIIIDTFKIEIKKRHNAKYLRLKIDQNGQITLSLPNRVGLDIAINFIKQNIQWLKEKLKKLDINQKPQDEFLIFGFKFKKLECKNIIKNAVFIFGWYPKSMIFSIDFRQIPLHDNICGIVTIKQNSSEKFIKSLAKNIFLRYILEFKKYFDKPIKRVTVKNMKTRWGSCNSRLGYINLSSNLLSRSKEEIEYVIIHELTHLLYPHHKSSFYNYIEQIMPNFRQAEKKLRKKII